MLAYNLLLITHISTSIASLVLFWIPAISRKGGINHKKYGLFYARTMYVAIASGICLALALIVDPQWVRPEAFANATTPEAIAAIERGYRAFFYFILYLGVFTVGMVHHGMALYSDAARSTMKQAKFLILPVLAVVMGAGLMALGVLQSHPLFIGFSILGIVTAVGQIRYCLREQFDAKAKVTEHLGALVGSGIGAHTAFLTFGARKLLELEGYWQLTVWIAPGVIGGFAIAWLTKKYGQPKRIKA